ncbi:hypothetical protein HanIR_Chr14g0682581 [Helianthus annuus]|nr:hypothetical protein HanIR_Chr14g0682581 [Helianthus annuus]
MLLLSTAPLVSACYYSVVTRVRILFEAIVKLFFPFFYFYSNFFFFNVKPI